MESKIMGHDYLRWIILIAIYAIPFSVVLFFVHIWFVDNYLRTFNRPLIYTRIITWPLILSLIVGYYGFFPDEEDPTNGLRGLIGGVCAVSLLIPLIAPTLVFFWKDMGVPVAALAKREIWILSGSVMWLLLIGAISASYVSEERFRTVLFVSGMYAIASLLGAGIGAISGEIFRAKLRLVHLEAKVERLTKGGGN